MADKLYLGTRRYSSWSLRGWLMVKLAKLQVEESVIPIAGGATAAVKAVSPNGLVPYLEHQGAKIWESLAIAEYCAEFEPALWPTGKIARAHARSIAAEMHAGFRSLRQAMPMNLGRNYAGLGQNAESLADIARIDHIFTQTRASFGTDGPYLFGTHFNAADAMFAPVVARFITFQPPLSAAAQSYVQAVRAHPLVDTWYRLAMDEPLSWRLDKYESLA
ncbi:MAG TPA: glutathione S-transferase family protein [Acidocella sp.]|nr:glutathione S-transferase family protein [Acidocella sp.]OYV35143.1 MAG: glutathione S-transferase [Acidocella sp. 20-61-6]HQT38949.1 glutathione S-transferase family protein [Acidocella sp.]